MTVFANRRGPDTLRVAFYHLGEGVASVRLASPFFSYVDGISHLAVNANLFLIVRLGPATDPEELEKALAIPNVQIRYFTSSRFHTKLYIFGQKCALVGSANLTGAGMQSNREATVSVVPESPDFDELVALFEGYWSEAHVLTEERLAQFRRLCHEHPRSRRDRDLEQATIKELGLVEPSEGIQVDGPRSGGEKLYLEDYRRTYQSFETAFREVERIYRAVGIRRTKDLPLRIEIDQFINYLRGHHCSGSRYQEVPLLPASDREAKTRVLLDAWRSAEWPYMYDRIIPNYSLISGRFGTPGSIDELSMDEILEALEVCHAFKDQFRFPLGGIKTLREDFAVQDLSHVRRALKHLLHADAPYIERMPSLPTYVRHGTQKELE